MPQIRQLCWASLLLVSGVAGAANVRLQVEGLSGELEKNVRAQLSTIQSDEVTPDRRFRARVDDAIREGLKALGYYEPTIDFELKPPPEKGRQVLVVRVTPGIPIKIGGTDVILRGGARNDRDYLTLLKQRPAIGTVLNQGDYDHFKSELSGISLRKGYFDSEFKKSQLGISLDRHQAFWDIDYDSGQRYRFGDVTFEGSQIQDQYLQNLVPFKEGDYYTSADLAELNRRLSATGWFNSVVVAPVFDKARDSKVLPLHGVVSPRTENTIETGVGYSTDVGPRVKASWKKPWMNSYGHSLSTDISLSGPEQLFDFTYKMPLLKNPLEQYYLVQGGFKRTNLNDTKSDSTTLGVSRYWDLSSGWQRAINLRWSLDHFTQAQVTNTTMLLYPGVMVSRTRSRGGLMPNWGDSQRYSVDYSSTAWGSDVDFIVAQAQNTWIRTLYDKHRFVIRGNLGWIETNDFDKVPPDLRFFAGGDRSIRGYSYKSISPKDSSGKLTGASKLATGSLEYQYNVTGKWWGAVFVDSGEAVDDFRDHDFKTGAGVGVRWASPIGPVKFDIAAPVGDKEVHGLQFYIGLGPEL
ncbi:autotransporter assembly complex protein TamA [Pluralibacter sp.]|uniref:autotransporter assembly complex protein TamA n=1 Tax=Pluralibacter sp. TaxID=1920032 RepID=UPI0025E96F51|nr:autotransporter assembly complex protein TamA [Pluralibacter sp.]MBV8042665.1 autotransporter assembly complex protein TamA [Pluralibacter sp.]